MGKLVDGPGPEPRREDFADQLAYEHAHGVWFAAQLHWEKKMDDAREIAAEIRNMNKEEWDNE